MLKRLTPIALLLAYFIAPNMGQTACSIHDHNCYHGSTPFNPDLDHDDYGTGAFTITSEHTSEADVNLHVQLPQNVDETGNFIYGPFLSSNPSPDPVTQTPLGSDPSVIFHGQQTVQFANATSLGTLTSDDQPADGTGSTTRTDEVIISGNIPPGLYSFTNHSYNSRNVADTAEVSVSANAGDNAFFLNSAEFDAERLFRGHLGVSDSAGLSLTYEEESTLAPGEVAPTVTLDRRYRNQSRLTGFNRHARGVYVIPDGVWNLHGVDPAKLYQFARPDMSEGFLLNQGFAFDANPFDLQEINIAGFDWLYSASAGIYIELGGLIDTSERGGFYTSSFRPLNRVAIDGAEISALQTALFTPIEIMQQYGLENLSSDNRGDVKGFSRDSYNLARQILGCLECSDEQLLAINREIQTGSNSYGLNSNQSQEFNKSVINGYSASGLYREFKDAYNKGVVRQVYGQVVNAVLQYYTAGVLSYSADYKSDLYASHSEDGLHVDDIVIPESCAGSGCNGASQFNLANLNGGKAIGSADIIRVDSGSNTISVNGGQARNASVTDLGNDGVKQPVDYVEFIEGGPVTTFGVGYGSGGASVGVTVTRSPYGTSYGLNASYAGASIGVSCTNGDCSGNVGYQVQYGSVSAGVSYDTEQGAGANISYTSTNGVGVGASYTEENGVSANVSYDFTIAEDQGDGKLNGSLSYDTQTGLGFDSYYVSPPTVATAPEGDEVPGIDTPEDQEDSQSLGDNTNIFGDTSDCTPSGLTFAPCNVALGSKYQNEQDFNLGRLSLTRYYNSLNPQDYGFGIGWSSNFSKRLEYLEQEKLLLVVREDGKKQPFKKTDNGWQGQSDSRLSITENEQGLFVVRHQSGQVDTYNQHLNIVSEVDSLGRATRYEYDSQQRLLRYTEALGLSLEFTHDDKGHIDSVTLPDGSVYRYEYDAKQNLVAVVLPVQSAKKENGKQSSHTPRRVYHYEDERFPNFLTGISDATGKRWSVAAYNESGKVKYSGLVQTTNASAQQRSSFEYFDDYTLVTDAKGNEQKWTFQTILGQRKLTSKINTADGQGQHYSYDVQGNLVEQIDAEGRKIRHAYSVNNQKVSTTYNPGTELERTIYYEYADEQSSFLTRMHEPSVAQGKKKTTVYNYTPDNRLESIFIQGYTPDAQSVQRKTSFSYDALGQLVEIDGPQERIADKTRFTYYGCTTGGNGDAKVSNPANCGQMKSIVNALGHETIFEEYDLNGRVVKLRDANGITTHNRYHARGWLLQQTQTAPNTSNARNTKAEQRISRYEYNAAGLIIKQVFPDGISLSLSYDDSQLLRSVTDNVGNRVEYDYDTKGNRTATRLINAEDGNEVTETQVTQEYDIRDRVSSVQQGASTTAFATDAAGQLRKVVDPNQVSVASNEYDVLGRLKTTLDALGNQTSYDYNVIDRLTKVTSPNGAVTQYSYDDFGNKLSEKSPDRGMILYHYDFAGNMVRLEDAKGDVKQYAYDALNRIVEVRYSDATLNQTFRYDLTESLRGEYACLIGKLCQIIDGSGGTAYGYDAWGNMTVHQQVTSGYLYSTYYTHDKGNRVLSMRYPDGSEVRYQRDILGRITDVVRVQSGGKTNKQNKESVQEQTSAKESTKTTGTTRTTETAQTILSRRAYRADGQFTEQRFANNVLETRQYDDQARLTQQTLKLKDATVSSTSYAYDANGNILQQKQNRNTEQLKSKYTQNYRYDELNRLVNDNVFAYDYDANGNRLNSKALGKKGEFDLLGGLSNKQLSSKQLSSKQQTQFKKQKPQALSYFQHSNQVLSINQMRIKHDANGNQLNDENGREYEYDVIGQLVKVTLNGLVLAQYRYNAQRQRVEKKAQGLVTHYHYNAQGQLLQETRYSPERVNWHGTTQIVWVDAQPVYQQGSGYQLAEDKSVSAQHQSTYLIADHLNTPRIGFSESATISWRWQSDGFGSLQAENDPDQDGQDTIVNLRFPGQYFDVETGLHYNWHRYYNPITGRYITSDPIGLSAGINTYAYVGGNPLTSYDLLGLCDNLVLASLTDTPSFAEYFVERLFSGQVRDDLPSELTGAAKGVGTVVIESVSFLSDTGIFVVLIASGGNQKVIEFYGDKETTFEEFSQQYLAPSNNAEAIGSTTVEVGLIAAALPSAIKEVKNLPQHLQCLSSFLSNSKNSIVNLFTRKVPEGNPDAFTADNAFDTIDQFRKNKTGFDELGDTIPVRGDGQGTVAFVDVGGTPIFGVNSSTLVNDVDKNLSREWRDRLGFNQGEGQVVFHAEAHSLIRAFDKSDGNLPSTINLFVDRQTCGNCQRFLPELMHEMGVDTLNITMKNGRTLILNARPR